MRIRLINIKMKISIVLIITIDFISSFIYILCVYKNKKH
jgi:hypothetical protein